MTTSNDRERMRQELRELVRIAKPVSADSSGYVDLSAYTATDPHWVERALASSRGAIEQSIAPPPSKARQ
jgi:hypothetical protein